jgi:DNA-binding beta-propeller fold protein YncE
LKLLSGAIGLVCLAMLGIAGTASASETIYWDNYGASPATIGFANIDGTFGGVLNGDNVAAPGTEVRIRNPEGIAYDPANGRIYVANAGENNIAWFDIDGGGAGVLDTAAGTVQDPEGIAVDPETQTVYWANAVSTGSIGFASAEGGSGGLLNTTGATTTNPYKVALDVVNKRIYWINEGGTISYAGLNGSGGGNMPTPVSEAEQISGWSAINFDPATNRLYVLGENRLGEEGIVYLSTVAGLGGGLIKLEDEATYDDPYGLAFDPAKGRFYWANYGKGEDRAAAFGTTTLDGAAATTIGVATAPLDSPQDPVIVKSPVGVKAPSITESGTQLTCSQGEWEADSPGSYVYAAPASYAYQWAKDGTAIGGATGSTLTATQSGSYSCTVTATNRSGSASQASAGHTVRIEEPKPKPVTPAPPKPAALTLKSASKGAVKVKAGKTAAVKVDLTNAGGTASGSVKVCGKLTKAAKKGLVAPKCTSVASVPAAKTMVAKLMVKTKAKAKGTYKLTVNVSGALTGSLTAKVQVLAAQPKQPKVR